MELIENLSICNPLAEKISSNIKKSVEQLFVSHFGEPDVVKFAPGRANIIGEHTDYNDGYVFPFAISQGIYFYAKRNTTSTFHIIAHDTAEEVIIYLDHISVPLFGWQKYFHQVILAMKDAELGGINLVFGGNLPIGAGVSSSSALTCGLVAVINELFSLGYDANEIVNKALQIEHGYGVKGGIMDQFTITNAIQGKAIFLDCKDNTCEHIDLRLGNHHFYLINTNVKHNLIHTDYNNRTEECASAVEIIKKYYRPITSLRDVDYNDLPKIRPFLEDGMFNRVSFVVQENRRVLEAKAAILAKNYIELGMLLYASHDGLSDQYEVSCEELDWLVSFTFDYDNILGARMMGGGFGGCTINLVKGEMDDTLINVLEKNYFDRFGFHPTIIPISSSDGIMNTKI